MQRMGSLDAVFLAIEQPTSPMNIGSVSVFDGPAPTLETVREFVAAKLASVPRCRQRAHFMWLQATRPVWIDDADFDLANHVRATTLCAGGASTLEEVVEQVMVEPLDRRRSLWQMLVVDGLDDQRWAVVSTMHHCMVDGVAGTDLLAVILDAEPDARHAEPLPWAPERKPSWWDLARFTVAASAASFRTHLRHLARMLRHPLRTCRRLHHIASGARGLWLQPSRRDSPLTGPLGTQRRWMHTSIPLDHVASVRRGLGGTVNDVVLTAVTRGLRELIHERKATVRTPDVMALVPVSMRGADDHGRLDNRVAVTHALLPVAIDDAADTHRAVRAEMVIVKASHETDASTVLLHSGDLVPHAVAAVIARAVVRAQQNIETIVTNVPGPRQPLYLCGRRMLMAYPFAPIAGRIQIAVAIWSYCGTLYIGVTGDRDGAGDIDVLIRGIDRGFADLGHAAGRDAA